MSPASGGEPPDLDPAWRRRIRDALAAWFEDARRDLPWRRDRDPYRVLVSETMLVQTTVAAVVPFFGRFVERFPTAEALAAAPEADVLKAWEGLGYYRRARQLHQAARAIVAQHGGAVPSDPAALRRLPGVGRYIAGAVLSLAFGRPEPILEANTRRVLARLLAWPGELGAKSTEDRLWEAAGRLVPETDPGLFNEALMELGALMCTPREPACLVCPIARDCLARREGKQDQLPVTTSKPVAQAGAEASAVVRRGDGRVLIVRRGTGRLWAGFWEFPTAHVSGADPAGRALPGAPDLAGAVETLTGIRAEMGPASRTVRYGVTRYRMTLTAHPGAERGGDPAPGPGLDEVLWERVEALRRHPFGSAQRRVLAWAESAGPGPAGD